VPASPTSPVQRGHDNALCVPFCRGGGLLFPHLVVVVTTVGFHRVWFLLSYAQREEAQNVARKFVSVILWPT
jgi:hypothetical protein